MGTSLAWRTDGQLHDAVRRQLDEDPALGAHDIAVVASEGVVTLTGFADSYAAKIATEEAVKRVRGVRAVANDIEVRLLDERTDPEIAKDAVHVLDRHTRVSNRLMVAVRHGLVTLEGVLEESDQKDAAETAVKSVSGVRGVLNLIRIAQRPKSTVVP
jgi:osmotically-inducible protein OsmY